MMDAFGSQIQSAPLKYSLLCLVHFLLLITPSLSLAKLPDTAFILVLHLFPSVQELGLLYIQ